MNTEFKKLKRTHFYWISLLAIGIIPILLFFFYWIGGISFNPSDLNKINLLLLSSVHNRITFPLIIIMLAKMDLGVKGVKTLLYLPIKRDAFILFKLAFSFLWMLALVIFSIVLNITLGRLIFNNNEVLNEIINGLYDYGIILILGFSIQCLSLFVYYLIDRYILTLIILIISLFISYGLQLYKDFTFLNGYLSKYFILKPDVDIHLSFHLMSMFIVIIMSLIGLHTIILKIDRNN